MARSLWHLHPAVRTGGQLSLGERAADALKAAFGTWTLLGLIVAGIFSWMMFVTDPGELHLNLALSFLASVQGVILQIAANRGDRISAEVALHTSQNTESLLQMQRQELAILGRVDHMNAELNIIREHVAPGVPNPEQGVDDVPDPGSS